MAWASLLCNESWDLPSVYAVSSRFHILASCSLKGKTVLFLCYLGEQGSELKGYSVVIYASLTILKCFVEWVNVIHTESICEHWLPVLSCAVKDSKSFFSLVPSFLLPTSIKATLLCFIVVLKFLLACSPIPKMHLEFWIIYQNLKK